jgi:hypothetical protein
MGWSDDPKAAAGGADVLIPGSDYTMESGRATLYAVWKAKEDPDDRSFVTSRELNSGENFYTHAKKLIEGEHCVIYVDRSIAPAHLADMEANKAALAAIYDGEIYPLSQPAFGSVQFDVLGAGQTKVVLLFTRLSDSLAGYFSSNDLWSADMDGFESSNQTAMINCTTQEIYPDETEITYTDGLGEHDSNITDKNQEIYRTLIHELQHLIGYSLILKSGNGTRERDAWIDEGCSVSSEYLYNIRIGSSALPFYVQNYVIGQMSTRYLATDKTIIETQGLIGMGNTCFIWGNGTGGADDLGGEGTTGDYATAFMLFQWLRTQADNGSAIYKDIIEAPELGYEAVLNAAKANIDSTLNWETLLGSWFLSNYFYTNNTGLIGYGKDPDFTAKCTDVIESVQAMFGSAYEDAITTLAWNPRNGTTNPYGDGGKLYPGEGVISVISVSGSGTFEPTDAGESIRFAGFTTGFAGSVDSEGPVYSGNRLLTFNSSTQFEPMGTAETAPIAAAPVSASVGLRSAGGAFAGANKTVRVEKGYAFAGMTDWKWTTKYGKTWLSASLK